MLVQTDSGWLQKPFVQTKPIAQSLLLEHGPWPYAHGEGLQAAKAMLESASKTKNARIAFIFTPPLPAGLLKLTLRK